MAKFDLFLLMAAGLLAVSVAAVDKEDSSSSYDDDSNGIDAVDVTDVLPSLVGMLGSKVAAADTMYDEYYDEDSDDDQLADGSVQATTTVAPTAPCCFPNVWQGRLKSDFGFVPIGGRRGKGSDDDDDNSDKKKKKKKKGGKRGGGRPSSSHSVDLVYVDGANKRLAGRKVECHGKGKSLNVSYIVLVRANRTADLYLFDRTAQKCRYRQLKGVDWRRQCLPTNSTLRGQYSLGPVTGGLTVQSWTFEAGSGRRAGDDSQLVGNDEDGDWWSAPKLTTTQRPHPRPRPRPRVFVAANVLVVPGSCTPVVIQEEGIVMAGGRREDDASENDFDDSDDNEDGSLKPKPKPKPKPRPKPRGEGFIGSIYFTGVQPSISDPTVFTVPSYCKKAPNTLYYDEMEDEVPAVVERFLVL